MTTLRILLSQSYRQFSLPRWSRLLYFLTPPKTNPYKHVTSVSGGEMSTPVGSEDEKKTLLWIQNYETPDEDDMFMVIFNYLSEPPRRNPLSDVHSINHAVKLIRESSKIMVLTGAGVSVSCGIPDFRSKDGVYARLAVDFPNLPDPQAMFDINFFRQDPRPFFKFAKEIYPGLFKPSPSHRFIKAIERHKKLLRNYTQNIDTLERVAGINNLIECHGSFATATCTVCCHKVSADEIKETIFQQNIPYCPRCSSMATSENEKGIMKPDIVFFGEGLPESFHDAMAIDQDQCDLLIVIGSSLKVRPVALIPSSIPSKVPQILINRERLPYMNFDVELLGDSDVIIDHLCRKLGGEWTDICWRQIPLEDRTQPEMETYSSDSSDTGSSDEDEDIEPPKHGFNKSLMTDARDFRDGKEGTDSLLSDPRDFQEDREGSVSGSSINRDFDEPVKIKCQKIGKRHIGGSDDNSRHISLDSSRDSGIGENSNNSSDRSPSPTTTLSNSPTCHTPTKPVLQIPKDLDNCFFCVRKRRYIFPGAEVPEIFYSSETSET